MERERNSFDESLRQALEGLPLPAFQEQDWALLEQSLDAGAHHIDTEQLAALEDLEMPFEQADWLRLEARLEQGEHHIDHAARQALQDLEIPFDRNDWLRLEQRLDAGEHEVDHAVREALQGSGHSTSQMGRDWALLEQRLQRGEHRSLRLRLYKSLEAALLLLLCLGWYWTVTQGGKTSGTTGDFGVASSPYGSLATGKLEQPLPATGNEMQRSGLTHTKQPASLFGAGSKAPNRNNPAKNGSLFGPSKAQAPSTLLPASGKLPSQSVQNRFGTNAPGTNLPSFKAKTPLGQPSFAHAKLGRNSGKGNAQPLQALLLADPSSNALSSASAQEEETPNAGQGQTDQGEGRYEELHGEFQTLQLPSVQRNKAGDIEDPLFELKPIKPHLHYKQRLRAGITLSADANLDSGYGNAHLGYGGGWLLEAEFNYLLSVQSGLLVGQKNYRSQRTFESQSPSGENHTYQVEEESVVRLTHLQVPLQIQMACFRNKQWRIGFSAGFMANFILGRSHVGTQKVYAPNGLTLYNQINPADHDRGWWQGASLERNFYCSLGGGLVVERRLFQQWSLFVQPQYYHSLQKRADRAGYKVGVFSMNVGLKKEF